MTQQVYSPPQNLMADCDLKQMTVCIHENEDYTFGMGISLPLYKAQFSSLNLK